MLEQNHHYARVLGIDPSTRGFGFAVLEASGRLVDWGVAEVFSKTEKEFLARVEILIAKYAPFLVAVEDYTNTRHGERAQRLVDRVVGFAHLLDIETLLVSRPDVRIALRLAESATKSEIAGAVGALFPELIPLIPPKRKPWTSEDERMNVFDAAGLAATALAGRLAKI